MTINNLEQFKKMLNFCFSEKFNGLNSEEKEVAKEKLKSSINKIDGSIQEMVSMAEKELKEEYFGDFAGNKKKIIFILECISDEDKICIIKKYLQGPEKKEGWRINEDFIFEMLELLPYKLQIETLSKADPSELLKLMSKYNILSKKVLKGKNYREKYKRYYNTCKDALAK